MNIRTALYLLLAAVCTSSLGAIDPPGSKADSSAKPSDIAENTTVSADESEDSPIKFSSPDNHFALRVSEDPDPSQESSKAEIIEKSSGKVLADLGNAYSSQLSRSILLWSSDSKRFAYGTGDDRQRETTIYFWNGSSFKAVALPVDLPAPDIKFHKGADRDVKNYGGGEKPVRWLKSGDLEISSESMMLSRVDDLTYTGTILITIGFDAQHHARIKHVSKTKTRAE